MEKMYFISHSYKDSGWAILLKEIIQNLSKEGMENVFFSSSPETGSDVKEDLLSNIDKNMQQSDCIILLITDNYLRSQYCDYEMNLASFFNRKGKDIIILLQSEIMQERIKYIFPDSIYINASKVSNAAKQLVKALDIDINRADLYEKIIFFFSNMSRKELSIGTTFLGMPIKKYNDVYRFIEENSVEKLTMGYPATADTIMEKIIGAKEIIFVSTTGSGFLRTYQRELADAVAKGADLSVVIADSKSRFSREVGHFEMFKKGEITNKEEEDNGDRIKREFMDVCFYLQQVVVEAEQSARTSGVVKMCCGYTLIRQTAFIIRYNDGSLWGWITCTMPPARNSYRNIPSIVFNQKDTQNTAVVSIWDYCKTLVDYAERQKGVITVQSGIKMPTSFSLETGVSPEIEEYMVDPKNYWEDKQIKAQNEMNRRKGTSKSILIEVAAQHPLEGGKIPNVEFRARLDKAIDLYWENNKKGYKVIIYVPGSRHKDNQGVADTISLSKAGCDYLTEKGIPQSNQLGEETNERYKGSDGVYNSADECYVAAKVFLNGDYEKLLCVCSPNQIMRKKMFYMEFGCFPVCYGVTVDKMFHEDIVKEIFDSLNTVLYIDHSWQEKDSETFLHSRKERKP